MNEFDLIQKYFLPLAQGREEALRLRDDAAIFNIQKNRELVVTSDISNAGIHFLENETPDNIARKCLRVNLSDLAAMGAEPYAYQMSIASPGKPSPAWIKKFSAALLKDQKKFGVFCSGGDTTRTKGPLSVAITAFGLVPRGQAVTRSGARPGDVLVITGPVGDAYIGLKILQKKIRHAKAASCIRAYRTPMPRTAIVPILRRYASAAIDISDGLIADAGHIARASGYGLAIDVQTIAFSRLAEQLIRSGLVTRQELLTGGDDYELALAVRPRNLRPLMRALKRAALTPQAIGVFTKSGKVRLLDGQKPIDFRKEGWSHF